MGIDEPIAALLLHLDAPIEAYPRTVGNLAVWPSRRPIWLVVVDTGGGVSMLTATRELLSIGGLDRFLVSSLWGILVQAVLIELLDRAPAINCPARERTPEWRRCSDACWQKWATATRYRRILSNMSPSCDSIVRICVGGIGAVLVYLLWAGTRHL